MKPFSSNHINERATSDNPNFERLREQIKELKNDFGDCELFFTEFEIAKTPDEHYYDCYLADPPVTAIPGDPMDIYRVPKTQKKGYKVYRTGDDRIVVFCENPKKFKRVFTKLHYDFTPYAKLLNWSAPEIEIFLMWFNMMKRCGNEPEIPTEFLKKEQA